MEDLINKINEEKDKIMWCAVGVTKPADHYHPKPQYSERVVSWDAYCDLRAGRKKRTKNMGRGRYGEEYDEIDVQVELLGKSYNKEEAMSYLSRSEKTVRKTKLNKGDADYVVWCISSGKFTASGKTQWDWNIWDNAKDAETEIFFGQRAILFGAKGSLKEGDKICCVDNDTQKKLTGAPWKIEFVCDCTLEAFQKAYRDFAPSMCKRPSFQFGKRSDGLPWSRFGQMYSIKGVGE